MVLLILAVLWGIVLGPWAWRTHTQRRRMRSVDNFRRRLQVLAPVPDVPRATRPSVASRPVGASRPAVAIVASPRVPFTSPQPARAPAPASKVRVRLSRATILQRRRRVLALLVAATVVALAAGFVPTLRFMWTAHLVFDVALAAYVVGLRRLRRLALERVAKVRYLPPPPAGAVVEAVAVGVGVAPADGTVGHSASS